MQMGRRYWIAMGLVLAAAGCEAPHDSIEAILIRQDQALRRLPEEDRARLADRRDTEGTAVEPVRLSPGLLELAEARRIALRGNPDIHAAQARLEDALARITEARSFYFPDVSFTHTSNRTFQTPNRVTRFPSQIGATSVPMLPANPTLWDWFSVVGAPLLGAYSPFNTLRMETGNQNSFSEHASSLSVQWTIFDSFVREARLLSAKHGSRASAMALADAERLLIEAVDTAYYQVQLGHERLRIARSDEQFSREQLAVARKKLEAGKITEADVLNFEVRVRAAQADVVAARGAIDTGRVLLAELMGLPDAHLPEEVRLAELRTESESELTAPDVDAWITQAMALRPDLAEADYVLKARAENILLAKGQFGPELVLQGAWGFERLDNINYADEDQASSVGVELRWPLFTGGFRTSQLRRARAQWWEARERLRKKRLQVASEVRRAVVEVVNAQEQVRLRRMNLASAIENRRIVQKEYAAGKASLVRLNEAQRDLIGTEAELARARIRLRLAWSKLHSAAGYYVREGPGRRAAGHLVSDPSGSGTVSSGRLRSAPAPEVPVRANE